jgi:hypothetical protein
MSKYWIYRSHVGDMGLVSLVASCQQKVSFAPTISLVGSGEKLDTDPRIGQPSWCGLCQEPFFSGAVDLLNSVDDYAKGCYALTMWDTYGLGPYADRAWDAYGVFVWFCRVYIDSNLHDSRIWVLLVCRSHHIDNLMNLMSLIVPVDVLLYYI